MREIAESERDSGIRFKIVEKGGITIEKMLQKSNPTASGKCGKPNCVMDNQPEGGKLCHKSNIMYEWRCELCDSSYIGETSRNFFSRSLEHMDKAQNKSDDSFISNHQKECQNESQPKFKTKSSKVFKIPFLDKLQTGYTF